MKNIIKKLSSPKTKNIITVATVLIILAVVSIVPAGAIDIATPINNAIKDIITNIKSIAGGILGLIAVVLVIILIIRLATIYRSYRSGSSEDIEYIPIILLIGGIIISTTATAWMWGMLG